MKHGNALLAGVIAGIAAPASLGIAAGYQPLRGTDLSRMRDDVQRVGRDFSLVINKNKKHGEKSEASRKAA